MNYITGDTHGDVERFEAKPLRRLKKTDTLIVLGDFGFLWDGSREEKKKLAWLAKRRYKVLFLDGCHDNYDLLRDYAPEDFCGGRARHIQGNVYHVLRGSVLTIEGKKLLCFGGGESEDKEEREEGVNWWRAELPTSDELEWCAQNLLACGNQVDYILTHDAPTRLLEFTQLNKDKGSQPNWLHAFFDKVMLNTGYKAWYFGRYHRDQYLSQKARAVFCSVLPLE